MKQTGNGKRLALGALAAMAAYLALLALLALLVVRGAVGEGAAGACVWVCAGLAAFAGAKTAAWGSGRPLAALGAAVFCALALLLGFLTSDALAPPRALALAASSLAGGAAACLPRVGRKRKRRARHSRK